MIGSLDCSHFVGGGGHAVFGYCGMLNDISIWDSSYLLQSLCDGSFAELDFTFSIGGQVFDHLWMLVDGIYPSLARFVKPISVPIGTHEALFSICNALEIDMNFVQSFKYSQEGL